MRVQIDGVDYVPAQSTAGRIGIAITTCNRPKVLKQALEHHEKHLPSGAFVVVVDDGSAPAAEIPSWCHVVRHDESQGIVAAKNASLAALIDAGCEHLFLWDDDAWPIRDGWEAPYIASPEPHLAYQFLDLSGARKLRDITEVHRDDKHVAYSGQRGVMLYYHRSAIEKVGGFDPIYGRGMYEHSDLANRIYAAKLTSWRYADVVGSNELIYSLDEHEAVERSVSANLRQQQMHANAEIHNRRRDANTYPEFVPYRTPRKVAITTLLTSEPDPQRGKKWNPDPSLVKTWAASISGGEAIVLADELKTPPPGSTLHRVPAVSMNVYYRRWMHVYQWLRGNRDVTHVWVTDGSDVQMLKEPWDEMTPGVIYVGSEPKTLDDEWIRTHHKAGIFQDFLTANRTRTMLNAGLLGGSREDVMNIAHSIVRIYHDLTAERFWGRESAPESVGDMAAFNLVLYRDFADKIVTGPAVHTIFRAEEKGNLWAWWKHR